jgi:hypothetical protein
VRALALVTGTPYEAVYTRLRAEGFSPRFGFAHDRWLTTVQAPAIGTPETIFGHRATWMPCPAVKGRPRHTPQTFAATYPRGKYIVRQAGHVAAVIDGVVQMEPRREGGGCVYGAWRFTDAE